MAIYYIYKIYKPETDFIYIGSTTNFKDRKRTHKSRCIKESNKEYNNYSMYLLEDLLLNDDIWI